MHVKPIFAILLLTAMASTPARADLVYAAVRDGSFNGVAMFTPTLDFINQVTTDGPILGLAAGLSNDFYVSVGNHTDEYSNAGVLLHTISGSPTTVTPALAFGNGFVYAAVTDGSFNGVAMFTPTLDFVNQVITDGPILGLAAGVNNDFYVSVGNHTDEYNDAGVLLHTISGSPTTVTSALSYFSAPSVVPAPTVAEPSSLILVLLSLLTFAIWRRFETAGADKNPNGLFCPLSANS